MQSLKDKHDDAEVNWKGKKLCFINLKWDCTKSECQLNVTENIKKTPEKMQASNT